MSTHATRSTHTPSATSTVGITASPQPRTVPASTSTVTYVKYSGGRKRAIVVPTSMTAASREKMDSSCGANV